MNSGSALLGSGSLPVSLLMAIGLAMDCTAVAIAYGLSVRPRTAALALRLAGAFGLSQALGFAVGWSSGYWVREFIDRWDHWIVFLLLVAIGGKMIRDSFHGEGDARGKEPGWGMVIILSLATSMDSMAVGLGSSLLSGPILFPALLIGLVSFILPLIGFFLAGRFGEALGRWAERIGGAILMGIGCKILLSHLQRGV
jgi:manganese efflux pump family protein